MKEISLNDFVLEFSSNYNLIDVKDITRRWLRFKCSETTICLRGNQNKEIEIRSGMKCA